LLPLENCSTIRTAFLILEGLASDDPPNFITSFKLFTLLERVFASDVY
jgi:hypothetical protein